MLAPCLVTPPIQRGPPHKVNIQHKDLLHGRFVMMRTSLARLCLCGLGCLSLFLHVGVVNAAPNKALKRALSLYDQLQFDKSLAQLNKLSQNLDLSREQRAKVYLYKGFCLFYLKGPAQASRMLRIALKLAPDSQAPPQTPPPLQKLLQTEYKKLYPKGHKRPKRRPPPDRRHTRRPPPKRRVIPVTLNVKVTTPVYPGTMIQLRGTCTPHPPGSTVKVMLRQKGKKAFLSYPLVWIGQRCEGNFKNPFPATYKQKGTIEYFLIAKDDQQQTLGRQYSSKKPGSIPLQIRTGGAGWVVPVVIGVVVVGAAAATTYFLLQEPPGIDVSININALSPQPLRTVGHTGGNRR